MMKVRSSKWKVRNKKYGVDKLSFVKATSHFCHSALRISINMNKDFDKLKVRTQKFALDVINLINALKTDQVSKVIGNQLLRSATFVGANYRAACRARSKADFISKITIVEEEADESLYWIELLEQTKLVSTDKLMPLKKEAAELTAIFTASGKTAKDNR
jgi:four helix bundle protein